MNAFFLAIHPYEGGSVTINGIEFASRPWFKRSAIISPTENIAMGDAQPYGQGQPIWSSSLWWPNSCMDRATSSSGAFEGIDVERHRGTGVVVFNDGGASARRDDDINPPTDPGSGDARGLVNSRYWDPLQRGGMR